MYQLVQHRGETGLLVSTVLSMIIHGAVFAFLLWWQQLLPDLGPVQATYYVDIVNLPVADPRSGSPSGGTAANAPSATSPAPPAMTAPAAATKPPSGGRPAAKAGESAAFEERMSRIEGKIDAQRQAATIEALRKKVTAQGQSGVPGGTGSQAGSDYTAYLHSRLKDAFRETISYQSKNPYVMIRLTIDADGRIIRRRIERSSGDKVFELSVQRAITLAEQTIVPPPAKAVYEGAFAFRPQGVVTQ